MTAISHQIAFKDCSIILSEQLQEVSTQNSTITKVKSQSINQLQQTDTLEKLKAKRQEEKKKEKENSTAFITL